MKPPRTKYGNRKTVVGGINFDSAKEARRWCELRLLERGGEIENLKRQQKIALWGETGPILTPTGKQAHYVADFVYVDFRTHLMVVEDAKGYRTKEYLLKRAILAAMGITIKEV
jgi:hypothetical protein